MALVVEASESVRSSAQELAAIDRQVLRLFAMVSGGLAAATAAFLDADTAAASALVAEDPLIDGLQWSTEDLVQRVLMRPSELSEGELRMLVAVLRIVPELERSGDLVEHIALRTPQGLAHVISAKARGMVGEMGRIGVEMWRVAADAYADRDPSAADRLRLLDDVLDDLHVSLSSELAHGHNSNAVAIEMGLVARFYERLGDHAVNVTKRLRGLVPPPVELG
jgi:phosphate transport system protein